MHIAQNTTPFLADIFVFTDKTGARQAVVVVKGTFSVGPNGVCRPADEQIPMVYADQHLGDPGTTSILYECEFAPVKPRREVILNASVVAPPGKRAQRITVTLVGPGIRKTADVWGDRIWVEASTGVRASSPVPFEHMPLVWERAFGGSDHSHDKQHRRGSELWNPVGRGFHLNPAKQSLVGQALPNLDRPDAPFRYWSERPQPIGFGVVGRGWRPRIGFAGTYDEAWLNDIFPFLPADFDDRYFQSAPLDQQLDGALEGAAFTCVNMTVDGRFDVIVPNIEIPIRFLLADRVEVITPRADTVILEPEVGRIVLLWRAGQKLGRKLTALREVQIGQSGRSSLVAPRPGE